MTSIWLLPVNWRQSNKIAIIQHTELPNDSEIGRRILTVVLKANELTKSLDTLSFFPQENSVRSRSRKKMLG